MCSLVPYVSNKQLPVAVRETRIHDRYQRIHTAPAKYRPPVPGSIGIAARATRALDHLPRIGR
jgi:hypothetical protein